MAADQDRTRREQQLLRTELRRQQSESAALQELRELQLQLEQGLPLEPEEGGILVAFSGRDLRLERRFPVTADVSALYEYVRSSHEAPNRFRLMAIPREEVPRSQATLGTYFSRAARVRLIIEKIGTVTLH